MTSKKKEPASASGSSHAQGSADAAKLTAALQKQVEELKQEVKTFTEIAARSQAELQNAKMRMDKDGADLRRFAMEATLRKLLPTIDNFQRAFKHLPEDLRTHQWVKGVEAIEQELIRQVGGMGLQKFESLGHSLDPARHEVLMEGPGEKGKVVEVFEDGYEIGGKVLRPAKVKVGDGQPQAAS